MTIVFFLPEVGDAHLELLFRIESFWFLAACGVALFSYYFLFGGIVPLNQVIYSFLQVVTLWRNRSGIEYLHARFHHFLTPDLLTALLIL